MEFVLPDLGEGIVDAELVEWLVKPGDVVQRGQSLAEIMTDKATIELPSNFSGKIVKLLATAGDQVSVDAALLEYEGESYSQTASPVKLASVAAQPIQRERETADQSPTQPKSTNGHQRPKHSGQVKASPLLRRMAHQLNIKIEDVAGTGPDNRILVDDLAAFAKRAGSGGSAIHPGAPSVQRKSGSQANLKPGSRIKIRGLRRVIAERTTHANQTIPHFTFIDQCEVTDLVRMRESLKPQFAEAGIKLTYLPFFVKALVEALKEFPLVNSSLDSSTREIVLHDHYDIGIATDTPSGLLVPVIRDADRKKLDEVAREIERLSAATRGGSASSEELRGSTFTITSIGGIGGLISTPIINEPESGIMGIGRIERQPVYDERGNLRPADLVYLSFSFDHRVIDGADAARFSNAVIKRLKNPASLLMHDALSD